MANGFHRDILEIDCPKEVRRISRFIQNQVRRLRREGAVVGLSGGIDSALAAELCVIALGKNRVWGLILPEKESQPESAALALKQARKMGIPAETVDITPSLEGFKTYQKRDEVIRKVFPEYEQTDKMKMILPPDLLGRDSYNIYSLQIVDSQGKTASVRMSRETLRGIVAATNTKQRTRMMHLYHFAEQSNLLVCGTTNRTESVLGYFVKYGDGGVDIEPIAHLYKTQVYRLADHLGVIEAIRKRIPSPDTFSDQVSDEEFYFRIPYKTLDLLLYAWENGMAASDVTEILSLKEEQVIRAFKDFEAKFRSSQHLRSLPPSLKKRDKKIS